ncbi:MAG: hypothetical protein M3437_10790 [Chloroflexota bacterium]|nr:hypothetical protein [Chloroflexota bacterium]MDQ5867441.1 hypothetical protein [Chloroflexota bacterium]
MEVSVVEGLAHQLQQHFVGGAGEFGVVLEYGTLEELGAVLFAVGAPEHHFVGDGVALLGEAAVGGPVLEEDAADCLAGFGEGVAGFLGAGGALGQQRQDRYQQE